MKNLKDKYSKWIWTIVDKNSKLKQVQRYFLSAWKGCFEESYKAKELESNKGNNQILIQGIKEEVDEEISKKGHGRSY